MPDSQMSTRFGRAIEDAVGSHATVVCVNRKFFNESEGLERLQHLAANSLETEIHKKYLALSAFATLVRWTEHEKHIIFSSKGIHVTWRELTGSLTIDHASARHLEIVRNARSGSVRNGSLFATLNFTKTAIGKRMLRSRLLCPPNRRSVVESRLDSLDELLQNEEIFYQLQTILGQFVNLDVMVSHLAATPRDVSVRNARSSIRALIALKHTLEIAPKFAAALRCAETPVLMHARDVASDDQLDRLRKLIGEVLTDDTSWSKSAVNMIQQALFAVRSGADAELDVARMTYVKVTEALTKYVDKLSKELNVDLRLSYTSKRGYIFETPRELESEVPVTSHAVRAVRQGKNIRWSTETLLSLNNRLNASTNAVFERLHPVLTELRAKLRASIGVLYSLVNAIGHVDVCMSFAEMVTSHEPESFVRPTIDDHEKRMMVIKRGRHPIIEKSFAVEKRLYDPTDIVVGPIAKNVIITGPNGSGKSTLMKKVALINVMAHASCYVPAEFAQIRLCDRLFTRIGVEDDMEANSSTFLTEMREIAFILDHSQSVRSLILIDELGRGTSHRGGLSLAWSICETLALMRPGAHVFCATHFLQLAKLADAYPLLFKNASLKIKTYDALENDGKSRQEHIVENVATPTEEGYGIACAKRMGFPNEVVRFAETISREIRPKLFRLTNVATKSMTKSGLSSSTYKKLSQRLELLGQTTARHDRDLVRRYLENLRKKFVDKTATTSSSPTHDTVSKGAIDDEIHS